MSSAPIDIPKKYPKTDLDKITFTPPELRNRIESIMSSSMPNIKIENKKCKKCHHCYER